MEKIIVKWSGFEKSQCDQFLKLVDERRFTDCVLTAEGESIKAHRLVLAAASPYFMVVENDKAIFQFLIVQSILF